MCTNLKYSFLVTVGIRFRNKHRNFTTSFQVKRKLFLLCSNGKGVYWFRPTYGYKRIPQGAKHIPVLWKQDLNCLGVYKDDVPIGKQKIRHGLCKL